MVNTFYIRYFTTEDTEFHRGIAFINNHFFSVQLCDLCGSNNFSNIQ